jgi:hypothetical protein
VRVGVEVRWDTVYITYRGFPNQQRATEVTVAACKRRSRQVVGIEGDPPVPTGLTRSWERLLPAAALELGKQPGQIGAGVRASEQKQRGGGWGKVTNTAPVQTRGFVNPMRQVI